VACAKGLASFALGTDTAGSGRVPAALNGLFGLKPTRGLVSTRGVVPACRSLDCVSVFTLNAHDAWRVLGALAAYDDADDYARQGAQLPGAGASFRFAVPRELEFFGDPVAPARFAAAVARLADCGGEAVEIDFTPFLDAARLLYEGPWVSERYAAIKEFIARAPEAMHPVTRAIIEAGGVRGAVELFEANHRLQHLKRVCDRVVADVACVLTPTLGRAYTLAEVEADPVRLNSNLGHYTNFMNLLDYAAVAVPAGTGHDGVPVGVTLFGPALSDARLLGLAARFAGEIPGLPPPGAFESEVLRIVVCGAHLSGLPLNGQLTSRGAVLLRATRTAPCYRLFALPAGPPWRPGLVRDPAQGAAIEVEEWALPAAAAGGFLDGIPSPLVIGRVELADGSRPHGFLCEAWAVSGAREITGLGGWRAHLAAQATS
jgi:allophanate hydrolase